MKGLCYVELHKLEEFKYHTLIPDKLTVKFDSDLQVMKDYVYEQLEDIPMDIYNNHRLVVNSNGDKVINGLQYTPLHLLDDNGILSLGLEKYYNVNIVLRNVEYYNRITVQVRKKNIDSKVYYNSIYGRSQESFKLSLLKSLCESEGIKLDYDDYRIKLLHDVAVTIISETQHYFIDIDKYD